MIDQLVVWGGLRENYAGNSLANIFRAFHTNAYKLGIPSVWCDDEPQSRNLLEPGVTVIAADVWSEHIGPAVAGVDYCLHNFSGDPETGHILCRTVEDERVLRLQVYTSDARGDEWGPYRIYNRDARTLFQPWGCDLLAEEFLEPVYNPHSQEAVFVGAVWSDQYQGTELGNRAVIEETRGVLARHGLRFRHLTNVSDEENIAAVRGARVAPAFSGQWQVDHDLLPCRTLKHPAYGVLALSNVPAVQRLYGGWHPTPGTVAEMLDSALALKRQEYLGVVREQQRVVAKMTYRESLASIALALEEGRT